MVGVNQGYCNLGAKRQALKKAVEARRAYRANPTVPAGNAYFDAIDAAVKVIFSGMGRKDPEPYTTRMMHVVESLA